MFCSLQPDGSKQLTERVDLGLSRERVTRNRSIQKDSRRCSGVHNTMLARQDLSIRVVVVVAVQLRSEQAGRKEIKGRDAFASRSSRGQGFMAICMSWIWHRRLLLGVVSLARHAIAAMPSSSNLMSCWMEPAHKSCGDPCGTSKGFEF